MRKGGFGLCVIVFLAAQAYLWPSAGQRYWICFSESLSRKFIMQIDAGGKVIIPPFRISEGSPVRQVSDLALSKNGESALNLWFMPYSGSVGRIVIDKRSLRTLKIVQTNLKSERGSGISVSNRSDGNLVVFLKTTSNGKTYMVGYPIDKSGSVAGNFRFLSPALGCNHFHGRLDFCSGGIGPDGRIAHFTSFDRVSFEESLYLQPLEPSGQRVLQPVLLAVSGTVNPSGIGGITARLAGNRRLILYSKSAGVGDSPITRIQPVNATTATPNAEKIPMPGFSKLIDPRGRFVILARVRVNQTNPSQLIFRALDSGGHVVGPSKLVLDVGSESIFYLDLVLD